MADDPDYTALAKQAEHLSESVPDRQIASSWRLIARGFRQLARLRAGAVQRWRQKQRESAGEEH